MSSEFCIQSRRIFRLGIRLAKDFPALIAGRLAECGVILGKNAKRLETFRDKHAGEVAFMLGSGPSVRLEDLERLSGRLTFCCNRYHLSYSQHSLRPTYTLSCDDQMVADFGKEIADNSHGVVFFNDRGRPFEHPNVVRIHQRWAPNLTWFSTDAHCGIWPGGGTLIFGVQLGYFMGIRKFVLYGVDHSFAYQPVKDAKDKSRAAVGEGNHFIPNYRSGKAWWPPNPDQIANSFRECDQFLRARGGFLMNATIGGKLECLERMDLDRALKGDFGE